MSICRKRMTRPLRVQTVPKQSSQFHHTRSLSELILFSPHGSARITPRMKRFDMDVEVSALFAAGDGTVDILGEPRKSAAASFTQISSVSETSPRPQTEISQVLDTLFSIHSSIIERSSCVSTPQIDPVDPVGELSRMLECSICQDVFTCATEATCCGQMFCKDCIVRWVSDRQSCPMCRQQITNLYLVSSRHAQRMANEMHIDCGYCGSHMKKVRLESHMKVCEMRPALPRDVRIREELLRIAQENGESWKQFLFAPSPLGALTTQCYVRIQESSYELFTQAENVLICRAEKRRNYDFSTSFHMFLPQDMESAVARMDKNYTGSQYIIRSTCAKDMFLMGSIHFAATLGKSPRQMRVTLPQCKKAEDVDTFEGKEPVWTIERDGTMQHGSFLMNKPPVWIESLEAYCLDFGGRVSVASAKNFVLSDPNEMDKTLMLFGRTQDRQIYSMDYAHPFSPMQAFAIALSSLDSHLVTFD